MTCLLEKYGTHDRSVTPLEYPRLGSILFVGGKQAFKYARLFLYLSCCFDGFEYGLKYGTMVKRL